MTIFAFCPMISPGRYNFPAGRFYFLLMFQENNIVRSRRLFGQADKMLRHTFSQGLLTLPGVWIRSKEPAYTPSVIIKCTFPAIVPFLLEQKIVECFLSVSTNFDSRQPVFDTQKNYPLIPYSVSYKGVVRCYKLCKSSIQGSGHHQKLRLLLTSQA